ncbi:MAG: oligosaccharide flippase family protein [Muribaculaceae bacterium]|nr:oligosaccharide flippase family protein [Muribaculaceae bacterium]
MRKYFNFHFSDITKRILSGSFWVLSGSMVSKIMVFCATLIVVRILGQTEYGQLSIIRSTIQTFISLSAFGIGTTATKFISQYKDSNPLELVKVYIIANSFVFLIATLAAILIVCFAGWIANDMLGAPFLINDIKIAGIIIFFSLINGAQVGTLSGFEDFKRIAKSNVIIGCCELVLLSLGAYFFGVRGAILGFGSTYCVAYLYNSYYIRRHLDRYPIKVKEIVKQIRLSDYRIIYNFSLPIALTSWIGMPALWYAKTYLINNSSFEAMAVYDIADQWREQVLFFPAMIAQVLLPVLSNTIAKKETENTIKAIKVNLKLNGGITIIVAVIISLISPFIMSMYGAEYTNFYPLIMLAFAGVMNSISNVCGAYIFSSNRAWSVLKYNAMWAIVLISGSWILVGKMAENGLAFSYLCAATTLTTLMLFKTYRCLKQEKRLNKEG